MESQDPPDPEQRLKDRDQMVRNLGLFSVILGDLLGYTAAGILVGYLLWKKLSAPWWVLLVTTMAGLTLAMVRLYRISKKTE